MSQSLRAVIEGEDVELHADRALFWPRERTLLIADLHLGKADTFRSAGIALPSGGTRHDLRRLSALVATTRAERVIVIGDLLHSTATERSWRAAWDAWRADEPTLRIEVVAGNHDRALAGAALDIAVHRRETYVAPFLLRHDPIASDAHVVSGHLHPVVKLPGVLKRWPVFVLAERQTILPAFSAFTGGYECDRSMGRMAVCNAHEIAWFDASR